MGGFISAPPNLASPSAIGSTTPNTGRFTTLTLAPSANTTPFTASGYSLTGANAQSFFDLSGTWNTSGTPTAFKLNVTDTASNASSLLMDLQVGGSSRFSFAKNGNLTISSILLCGSINAANGNYVLAGGNAFFGFNNRSKISSSADSDISITNNSVTSSATISIESNNILSLRNSTNAQTFRLYNTFTDASNYERGIFSWSSNVLEIGSECAGTGTTRTTRLVAQDKAGGFSPVVELAFKPNNTLSKRLSFTNNSGAYIQWGIDGTYYGNFSTDGFSVGTLAIGFSSGPVQANDVILIRDAANILAQRNSTNAQAFKLYRTYTNASNYERLGFLATNTTRYTITSENAGTGSARSLEVSFYTSASDPTSTDITSGCFSVWKNSGTSTIKLWANDGGTMKSVALA